MNSAVAHAATVVAVTYAVLVPAVQAAEGGTGNYLQGKRGPLAAFVPKSGWYLTNDVYFMSGDRSPLMPLGDRVVGNMDAQALTNPAQVTWVAGTSFLAGRVTVNGVLPYGSVDVSAATVGRLDSVGEFNVMRAAVGARSPGSRPQPSPSKTCRLRGGLHEFHIANAYDGPGRANDGDRARCGAAARHRGSLR